MATFNCGSSVKVPGGFIEQTRKKKDRIDRFNKWTLEISSTIPYIILDL